ncbi:unnamed protein product [Closterium sp. NIES-53]
MADTAARSRLDYLWAAAVAENDWVFQCSKSTAVQAFVDAALAFAKPYTLPSPYKVGGPLLLKLRADTEELEKLMRDSWGKPGCSLTCDGWTCLNSRGLVCVIAFNDTAPVIVETVDSKTAKKAGGYLAKLLRNSISKVGDKAVVQVVMDNTANSRKAADILRPEYPSIFFNNCAAHVLDLMFLTSCS